jgi:CheY-like chemotaxis protein
LKQSSASLDAMILDIGLDDNRSGIEVLELMRLDDRFVSLPVVVLTGLSLTKEEEDCIRRNQAHLLHKKEGYEQVFNRLAEIVAPLAGRAVLPTPRPRTQGA